MRPLIEGLKELEVAELAFSFDIPDFLEPGAEIELDVTGFLDFTQRLDHGIVKLADVIRSDAAAEGGLHPVDKVNRVVAE